MLEQECDKDYDYTLMEYVHYISPNDSRGTVFINDVINTASKDKFFDTREQAITYLKEQTINYLEEIK